ncbi:MAG: AmmeMemoRadiSam system radical SAM enzyme [Anaerolineae bacterium]|nr:AmmeMemoRadiSam system radical SAM enzyme [Anaerolineae bacterium]
MKFFARLRKQSPPEESPFVRPALLYEPAGSKIRCLTCERRCVIAPGETGWCGTRQNRNGQLVTLTYGMASMVSANPIEKKPLYHFYPGSKALTIGSYSCNFACPWCQNYTSSKQLAVGEVFYAPEDFIAEAREQYCQGVSISFNEPTLSLEWSLEAFCLAHQAGLYNTFVTNGYMTEAALYRLAQAGLDAMNVDVKGGPKAVRAFCDADVEVVWRNLRLAQGLGIWIEVTTLVIPTVSDDPGDLSLIAGRISRELGNHVPWHVTRYFPAYEFDEPPTPVLTLEQARSIGQEMDLQYVYVGNVPGHRAENTFCPNCGKMLLQRWGAERVENLSQTGKCPACSTPIPGVGWDWKESR